MTGFPLTLGPLRADGFEIRRSGVHWFFEGERHCRANEVLGYCHISLNAIGETKGRRAPAFASEALYVAFAASRSGRVRVAENASRGGLLDEFLGAFAWNVGHVVAHLEPDETTEEPPSLRHIVMAGQRMAPLAEVSGLLGGWHRRKRAWWFDGAAAPKSLLGIGICDASGLMVGRDGAFAEMIEAGKTPIQLGYVPDQPLAPCAPVLLEQFERSPKAFAALSDDIHNALTNADVRPTADDWTFAGALLAGLETSPMRSDYDVFGAKGSATGGPPDAVLLSLSAEPQSIWRHKQLGYHLSIMRHRQETAGPAMRKWMASAFESVKRSADNIRADYCKLIDRVSGEQNTKFLIINRMTTSGAEDIVSYAPFDAPISDLLANVAAKELDLMLYDVVQERNAEIIDVDAIAAEIGGAAHLPDGIHQSGAIQTLLRADILSRLPA